MAAQSVTAARQSQRATTGRNAGAEWTNFSDPRFTNQHHFNTLWNQSLHGFSGMLAGEMHHTPDGPGWEE